MRTIRDALAATLLLLVPLAASVAGQGQDVATASDQADWRLGDYYEIHSQRHGVGESFKGDLVKVTPGWVVLHAAWTEKGARVKSKLGGVPVVGALFRQRENVQRDQFLWIPRDAAQVAQHQAASHPLEVTPPSGDQPPAHTSCIVQVAGKQRSTVRNGGLEEIKGDHLTLSISKQVAKSPTSNMLDYFKAATLQRDQKPGLRYAREQLPMRDVLCVRVANFEAAAREAVSR